MEKMATKRIPRLVFSSHQQLVAQTLKYLFTSDGCPLNFKILGEPTSFISHNAL